MDYSEYLTDMTYDSPTGLVILQGVFKSIKTGESNLQGHTPQEAIALFGQEAVDQAIIKHNRVYIPKKVFLMRLKQLGVFDQALAILTYEGVNKDFNREMWNAIHDIDSTNLDIRGAMLDLLELDESVIFAPATPQELEAI